MNIKIPYKPRKWSLNLHNTLKRWIILVLHRRAGKTTAVLNHLQRDCLKIKDSQFAYIGPTYKQSKMVAWEIAKKIARPIPKVKINESELSIVYPNGAKLILVGSDNPDSLRGLALWGVGFDEYPLQPTNIFTEIISKALADHLGYAIFFGTPKGKGDFYRMYKSALASKNWEVIFRTIDHTLKEEEGETVDNLRVALKDDIELVKQGLMTQDEFDQEWYCSFEAAIKGAYYSKEISLARKENRIKFISHDKELKVHVVIDLGVGPNFAAGFYQRLGKEIHMIDYWQGTEKEGMPEFAVMVQQKAREKGYVYGKFFAPHDIRGAEAGTGMSRLETAKKLGIEFDVIPMLPVDDGINAGKLMFARLWINDPDVVDEDPLKKRVDCSTWLDAVSQYKQEWDQKRNMFNKKPRHDWTSHAADVHRYAAIVEKFMNNEDAKQPEPRPHVPESKYEGTMNPNNPTDEVVSESDLAKM